MSNSKKKKVQIIMHLYNHSTQVNCGTISYRAFPSPA